MHLCKTSFQFVLYACVVQLKTIWSYIRDMLIPIIRPWSSIRRPFYVYVKAIFRIQALVVCSGKTGKWADASVAQQQLYNNIADTLLIEIKVNSEALACSNKMHGYLTFCEDKFLVSR